MGGSCVLTNGNEGALHSNRIPEQIPESDKLSGLIEGSGLGGMAAVQYNRSFREAVPDFKQ
jgi:hypothetical protein